MLKAGEIIGRKTVCEFRYGKWDEDLFSNREFCKNGNSRWAYFGL